MSIDKVQKMLHFITYRRTLSHINTKNIIKEIKEKFEVPKQKIKAKNKINKSRNQPSQRQVAAKQRKLKLTKLYKK